MSQVLELVSASPHRSCSTVYSAFNALVSQENYFQLALDVLLPVLRGDLRLPEVLYLLWEHLRSLDLLNI